MTYDEKETLIGEIAYYKWSSRLFLVLLALCVIVLYSANNSIKELDTRVNDLESVVESYDYENAMLKEELLMVRTSEGGWKFQYEQALEKIKELEQRDYVGQFKVTWYTAGEESTGKTPDHPEYGITATGTEVTPGQTIASDWSILPPGTKVYIEGIGERIVEDSGSGVNGKHIDVYIPNVDEAYARGVSYAKVYILEEGY